MIDIYDIICAHAQNYIGREQKEASSVEVELVVVQLYLGLYWSDSLIIPHNCRSRVFERPLEDAGTENRQASCQISLSTHGTKTHTPGYEVYFG